MAAHWRSLLDTHVEAVRIGTIVAHDRKAAVRWQSQRARMSGQKRGMSGMALEQAVRGLAARNPEYVVAGA